MLHHLPLVTADMGITSACHVLRLVVNPHPASHHHVGYHHASHLHVSHHHASIRPAVTMGPGPAFIIPNSPQFIAMVKYLKI